MCPFKCVTIDGAEFKSFETGLDRGTGSFQADEPARNVEYVASPVLLRPAFFQ
jgi:hypothetical protein